MDKHKQKKMKKMKFFNLNNKPQENLNAELGV